MTGVDATIQNLLQANPLREPVLRQAIQDLHLPPGSRGLDAGCGIGLQELLLAEAVGSAGRVTGLDIIPEFLAYGEELVRRAGLSGRVDFRQGDVSRPPFADDSFDWAWSADCIGYPLGELAPILKELQRVVRPGGSIAIVAWTSQQVLPGHPLLEARLNATCSSYAPYLEGKDHELHFLRALRHFNEAGLEQVKAQTFTGDVRAPLNDGERAALASLFEMLWTQPEAPTPDWAELQRLCRPGSADFILNRPGYYAFFTMTMFSGKMPQ